MEKKDPLRHATDLKSSDKAWEEYDTLEEEVLARVKNEIDKLPERILFYPLIAKFLLHDGETIILHF